MKINLNTLSDIELLRLIRGATAELESRISTASIVRRVPAERRVVTVREPDGDDKDFVLMIKAMLKSGGYIKADERRRVAEIATRFPEWARMQQVPSESGAGAWSKARAMHSMPRANER